jgi:hypothetical protein
MVDEAGTNGTPTADEPAANDTPMADKPITNDTPMADMKETPGNKNTQDQILICKVCTSPRCHKQTLFRYNSHLFVVLYHFLTLLMLYYHHYY